MTTNRLSFRFPETAVSFFKAIGIVLAFSPWLLIAYSMLSKYTVRLVPDDQDVIQGFIEWFGTAYSFFLALAVVNVWSQYETVDREFDRELDAVATLLQTVRFTQVSDKRKQGLLDDFKDNVEKDIKEYISHVIRYHKKEKRASKPEQHISEHQRNGDRILESIGRHISDLTCRKVVPEPFIDELFKSLNEAIDVRGDRISHSKPYTPVIVQVVSVIASAVWLLSFLGLVIYDELIATLLISGVAFVIIMVLVIFFDLGEPFGGIWKIHLEDWEEYLRIIDHDEDPKVIFIHKLKGTPLGRLRRVTRRDRCHLYDFAHAKEFRELWKQLCENIQKKRGGHPDITYQEVYQDQLEDRGLLITEKEWPLVVLKRGGKWEVLLDSQQINRCCNFSKFEDLFHQKMKEVLPWYEH